MNDSTPNSPTLTLRSDDAAALDALLAGARAGGTRPDPARAGTPGVAALVATLNLDAGAADRDAENDAAAARLVADTLARVAGADAAAAARDARYARLTLTGDDAADLDAVLEERAAPRRPGVAAVTALLDIARRADATEAKRAGGDDPLVSRTLAAVRAARQRERFARQVAAVEAVAPPRAGGGIGWRRLSGVAAVVLVGFSLLMPALARTRAVAAQQACATNLATAGVGLGAFAMDHRGTLPRGPVGDSWLKVGQPDAVDAAGRYNSNSAHLYLLIREDYLAPDYLTCAANEAAAATPYAAGQMDWARPQAVSYSYQNQHGAGPVRLDRARPGLAVLADKNPLFVAKRGRLVFDAQVSRDAASRQHRGAGQNILRIDGAAAWNDRPVAGPGGDDNVWTRAGHAGAYDGNEAPVDVNRDAFLVP